MSREWNQGGRGGCDPKSLSATQAEELDRACDRFEAAWRAGGQPRAEDHLGTADGPLRSALLAELFAVELAWRRRRGERPATAEYHLRFPADAEAVAAAFSPGNRVKSRPEPKTEFAGSASAANGLLLGLLAFQNNFIGREALLAALGDWVADKSVPLGQILVDRGALDSGTRALLDALAGKHLDAHGGDPEASLAALGVGRLTRESLAGITDPVLQAVLTRLESSEQDVVAAQTASYSVGATTTEGSRFRVLRPHARGGLGAVFVALDAELKREVALKQILDHHADDPSSRTRFVLEAEITGGLEHPGIVPVYGLGSYGDGRPYYAMRLIRGDSLKDAIAALHADETITTDPGGRSLALRKLLRRFVDVCNAIDYAHARGVIHRDIKPANVIVGKHGETLVIDWGLAKAMGKTGAGVSSEERTLKLSSVSGSAETLPGSAMGTPAYMSPEQAIGDLDRLGPRSDVYSLGATLYCLLVGKPPFEGGDPGVILQAVQKGAFKPPRDVNRSIDRALEAICLKAMALKPEDRYATPKALADEIELWAADEPVAAWREPFSRRFRRWARRHRTTVTAAAAVGVAVTVLLGGGGAILRTRRLRSESQARAALVQAGRLEAVALATSDPAKWGEAVAAARHAEGLLAASGGSAMQREVRARLDALEAQKRDRDMLFALDEARLLSANVKDGKYDSEPTHEAFHTAFRSYGIDISSLSAEEAARRVRSSRISRALDAALNEWALTRPRNVVSTTLFKILESMADLDSEFPPIRDALKQRDEAAQRRIAEGLNLERSADPAFRVTIRLLALSLDDKSALLPALRAWHHRSPSDFWANHELAFACVRTTPPRLEEAIRYYTAAAALRPASPGVWINLGSALTEQGDIDGAAVAAREAIRLDPNLAEAHCNLGTALRRKGDLDGAVSAHRTAIRINPALAEAHVGLGVALYDKHDLPGAAAACREALRLKPDFAVAHLGLGNALLAQRDVAGAIAAYRAETRISPDLAEAHYNLGVALRTGGDVKGAIVAGREAIRLKPDYAEAHISLGNALADHGDSEGAVAAYRVAIRLKPGDVVAHYNLGNAQSAKGDVEGAIASYREAIRLKPDYAEVHCNLGIALRNQGRFSEALQSLKRGHELGSAQVNWHYPSAQWVRDCRQLVDLEAALPAILNGDATPKDANERLTLAGLANSKRLHSVSARFYDEAFSDEPKLAADPSSGHRYNAACAAALAGSGKGNDEPRPDDAARTRWRAKALDWLRADLAAWGERLNDKNPRARQLIQPELAHWKIDPDLVGIRDDPELTKLSEAERKEFRRLWAEVDDLFKKASDTAP